MSGFEIIESGGYELIDEFRGTKTEKWSGDVNGHFVEVGKTTTDGREHYSVRVDYEWVATAESESAAQAALRKAVG